MIGKQGQIFSIDFIKNYKEEVKSTPNEVLYRGRTVSECEDNDLSSPDLNEPFFPDNERSNSLVLDKNKSARFNDFDNSNIMLEFREPTSE